MRLYYKKLLLLIVSFTINATQQGKREFSYTIKKQFQSTIKAVHFNDSAIHISSSFSLSTFPCIIIFVPTDKVRDHQQYAHSINHFLENFSLTQIENRETNPISTIFFLMTQVTDGKSSTKRSQGEILAQFIEWLYSYNKNCTIILISDRNGSSIINHASHTKSKGTVPSIHTVIQLYPTITTNATNQVEQALQAPNKNYYQELFIVYSDHVNTFTNKKGQKLYPTDIPHRSCLPLQDNEQIAPEEFLSTFCANRLWSSLQKAKSLYPHHKNFVTHWSSENRHLDQVCFLKDSELHYSSNSLPRMPLVKISHERATSTHMKQTLQKALTVPIKTSLPLSEKSKYFYDAMSTKVQ